MCHNCVECECLADKALQTAVEMEQPQPVSGVELTVSELQQQMAEIQSEMEKRTERVAKYKRLYYEEKTKCEEVTAQLQMLLQVLHLITILVMSEVQYNILFICYSVYLLMCYSSLYHILS